MTSRQIAQIQTKITKIKRSLAAEKRKLGDYDDSRGIRFLPPKYFIQLQDYKGGLTYLKWYSKQFPEDIGFPTFLFEWTIILFQCGKIEAAASKAFETFCANTYLFDKFFGRPIIPLNKWEGSNLAMPGYVAYFEYASNQPELATFSAWLQDLITSDSFKNRCDQYLDIHIQLQTEQDPEQRMLLISQANLLEERL